MDWEARYKVGDMPWEKGQAHPALPDLLLGQAPAGAVLVPGCGTGHDVSALAKRFPERLVVGVDIAESAVTAARARCQTQPNVRILHADFLADSAVFAPESFGMLWEHTCFCAISPELRPAYAATAARLLVPGGILLGVFFLRLQRDGDGPPWNCPEPELYRHFEAHFEINIIGPSPTTFPGREEEEFAVIMRRK